jgi:pimeloyl-ACP methyl ester carboxylesterase
MHPTIRYAKSGQVHVAYQVFGDGTIDLILVPGFISHLEHWWSEPGHARWLRRLGEVAVVLFDKRGTGLSDRLDSQPGNALGAPANARQRSRLPDRLCYSAAAATSATATSTNVSENVGALPRSA